MINDSIRKFEVLKEKYTSNLAEQKYVLKSIDELNERVESNKELEIELQTTNIFLNEVSNKSRELAKEKLEMIVTNALQYAFDKDIKFLVNLDIKRGVPSVEFKIATMVNGVESIKNPIDSNGGGVVDIISTALRYAYLMSVEEDLAKIIVLDEPGKMISKGEVSTRYAEFINDLSDSLDIQTIFVTHNAELEELTTNLIHVTNVNGSSKIN